MTKEGQSRDKERAQGTMAQKSTQTKTAVMRVLFNLYGTVLSKDAFRPPFKVPEKSVSAFCF